MRKYYLFIIKKEYYNSYKNKSYVLYQVLESLKNIKAYDFSYGLNIYKNICLSFPVPLLKNYFSNRIKYEQINKKIIRIESDFEDTYVQLNYSCIIILSNCNFPQILKIFNIYNKNIFVCDFKNKDFFWLNEQLKKTTLKI
jgi:hypothetical protein